MHRAYFCTVIPEQCRFLHSEESCTVHSEEYCTLILLCRNQHCAGIRIHAGNITLQESALFGNQNCAEICTIQALRRNLHRALIYAVQESALCMDRHFAGICTMHGLAISWNLHCPGISTVQESALYRKAHCSVICTIQESALFRYLHSAGIALCRNLHCV